MKNRTQIQTMTIFAMFIAIELVLMVTPLGYIPMPFISLTTMHIPVIAASILLGTKYGMGLGVVFGLASIWKGTTSPTPTSFLYSPFITVGGISGNWTSLLIALVPRIAMGWTAGASFNFFRTKMNNPLAALLAGIVGTMTNTVLTLGLIYFLFGTQYAMAIGQSPDSLVYFLLMVVATNGIGEAILAGIICMALVKAIKPQPLKAKADTKKTDPASAKV